MLRTPSLCYLLGYCYICTVRGGAKSVGDRFDHRCLYRSFTAGEEGREIASEDHTDLAVLIPSLIPFVLVVIVKWRKRISRDSRLSQDSIFWETKVGVYYRRKSYESKRRYTRVGGDEKE